jgi:hypothetical protein
VEGAIRTTGGSGRESVSQTLVTLLSKFDGGVSTGGTQEATGRRIARVGECGVMKGRLTDFIESLLNDAVAAGAAFKETGSRAAVTITAVTVVALLGRGKDTITADGSTEDCGGEGTGGRAEFAGGIALFRGNGHAVAAGTSEGRGKRKGRGFERTGGATAIPSARVPVIAGFGGREDAVAAEGGGGDESLFRDTGGRATIIGADVAIITGFTGVGDAVSTDGEVAGDAATIG